MYIQLEDKDYEVIAKMIADKTPDGKNSVWLEDWCEIVYDITVYGGYEMDYFNGTGAWGTSDVEFDILEINAPDIEVRLDEDKLIEEVKEMFYD